MGDETEEQKKANNEAINAAVTAQVARKLPKMLEEALAPAVAAALKPFQEQIAQLTAGGAAGATQGQGGNQQAAGAGGAAQGQSADVAALLKKIQDLERKSQKQDEDNKAAIQIARNERRDALLGEHLTKIGVDPNLRRGAATILRESMVFVEEKDGPGAWKFRAQRDGYHDDIDISAGLAEWSKTDEGKGYIKAPPRVGGAGTRATPPGAPGAAQSRLPDPKAAQSAAKAEALVNLNDAVGSLLGTGSIRIS